MTISETIDDHNHHIGDHDDDDENLPNSGESHESPPEGVKERPGAGRVVLDRSYNLADIFDNKKFQGCPAQSFKPSFPSSSIR